MANAYFTLAIAAVICFLQVRGVPVSENYDDRQLDPVLARSLLSTDFEDGMGEWFDYSSGDVNWLLEALDSPLETQAPQPATGSKYLRVARREAGSSGTAVLRSPTFTAYPGDEITFKFWIRSRHLQTNNLEVYWLNEAREERLLSLSQYSSPSNFEWRTVSVEIPVTAATNTQIYLYGFCGYNEEDSIAVDDIIVGSSSETTTTTPSPSTKSPCPRYLGGMPTVPCYEVSSGCYCAYKDSRNYFNASDTCRLFGMNLLSLETQEEDAAVANVLLTYEPDSHFFTSLRYNSSVGNWVWGSGGQLQYSHWDTTEPNGSGSCMYLNRFYSFRWADGPCDNSYFYFICELSYL